MKIIHNSIKKKKIKIINQGITCKQSKIAIIISRFNMFINQNLLKGAIDSLHRIGKVPYENITIIKVPGAYEIPIIANKISISKKYHGIITLGTIIKGETIHFETMSHKITYKLLEISISHHIPISLGILMTDTVEQAINRSGNKLGNKGSEAALAILETINIINTIEKF